MNSLFNTLTLRRKFAFFAVLCIAMVSVPTAIFWAEASDNIVTAKHEQKGVIPIAKLLQLIRVAQNHRGLSASYLAGNTKMLGKLQNKVEEVDRAVAAVDIAFNASLNDRALLLAWSQAKSDWHVLKLQVRDRSVDHPKSFTAHTALLTKQLSLLDQLLDYFGLTLDPHGDSYFLINAALVQMPAVAETLGQVRAIGTGMLASGSTSDAERGRLRELLARVTDQQELLDLNLKKASRFNATLGASVAAAAADANNKTRNAIAFTHLEIIQASNPAIESDYFYDLLTNAIDAQFKVNKIALDGLLVTLDERVSDLNWGRFKLTAFILSFTLLIGFFGFRSARGLMHQLGGEPAYAIQVVKRIAEGDLEHEISVATEGPSLLNDMRTMQHRLLENDRMKKEFVSTVSHELRTPLTSIGGALGLLAGGVLGEIPPKAKHVLDIANKNSQRLAHLIDDLLDMEKLVAGKMRLDLKPQWLTPLVEQAIEANRAYAEQYQVRLLLTAREDNAIVMADPVRLQQVITNFLSNAAKFSPQGGQVEVNILRRTDSVRVEVIDHGRGIPTEFRTRIFQKFAQADSSDTRQKGGTGLGLAISKELIERMHGQIGFNSKEGQGALFYFELPLWKAESETATNAPVPTHPPGSNAAVRLLAAGD